LNINRYYKHKPVFIVLLFLVLMFGYTWYPALGRADTATPLTTGSQAQGGLSFSITESAPGAFAARPLGTVGVLLIECPAGVNFSDLPEINVVGDLELDRTGTRLNTPDRNQLFIPINKSSTVASTINFNQVKLTVDRTVPEGPVVFRIGGSSLDWESAQSGTANTVMRVTVAKDAVATVTTPAPVEQSAEAGFTIGDAQFILNGVSRSMDLAPYIKDGRTFVPLYYAAQGLGIAESNIFWDAKMQTVTLIKGDKLVQVQIGSTSLLVNGAEITLDVAPEIRNGRTCLPVALLAQVLGETATWDAASQTLVIE
jgi:hypothetical protein